MIEWIRRFRLRRQVRRARALIKRIDGSCARLGMPRWKRKQIWRDFITSENIRPEIFDLIKVK